MHPDLQNLIQLQRAETELKRAETALAELPARQAALAQRLAEERARLDAARAALDTSQRTRRQREGELQTLEAKRSKYKTQLMEVKTNKEYTAMLHEIEAVERDVRACEDHILVEMERYETLAGDVKREEADFKDTEVRFRGEAQALDKIKAELEGQAGRLRQERDAVAQMLSSAARELFTRVAKLRGSGVSEARDEMCQGCRMKVRPQMFMDLKRNDAIVQCPSCNRILYYDPPAPTVLIQP
jgi:hypothetical protein